MHDSMLNITSLSIAIELIATQYCPMLFVPICLCLQEALPFEHVFLFMFVIVSEAHKGFFFFFVHRLLAQIINMLALNAKTT